MSELHFKILVPNVAAGAIIGKGGEAIETIKRQTGAKLKMSRADDLYPGNEIFVSQPFMLKSWSPIPPLVLSSESVVSQRPKDIKLFERCVVITGEFDERKIAVEMVMRKILEDPDSACYSNCSYSQVREPIASAFSSGSPFAMMYTPRLDMNGSNLDFNNNLENPLPNFPDTGLPTVTNQFLREDKLTKNQIDPFHYNRPLRLPLVGIDPYSGISVIPSTGQPLIFAIIIRLVICLRATLLVDRL
ncbi:unnamed protein product [Heterobilharzia americana]|nr:unnamed protein product [Heterobilharzia americana]